MDVVALYPITSHENDQETLGERLFKSEDLKLPVNDIVKMANLLPNITSLRLMGRFSSKLLGQQLVLDFLPLMHAFSWMR